MKINHYLFITTLSIVTLFGCSKSKDEVKPDTASLLTRKWSFDEVSVKTDAKTYLIPTENTSLFGETSEITFNKDNTYSSVENGQTVDAGSWKLSDDDKTLTLTDAEDVAVSMTVNSLTSTAIELASSTVDATKDNPTLEEMSVTFAAGLLLSTMDKEYGGTVDFTKEPEPKTLQFIIKGKAL